jgi:hypothetical protein
MRLRLRIELQDNAQAALGTVTWTPVGGTFATAGEIDRVFDALRDFIKGRELVRRVDMLRTLADSEIAVSAPPNINLST